VNLDAALAIGHHLAAFAVLATLAAEWALLRPGLNGADAGRIRQIDAAYGAAAGAVLVIGIGRLFGGVIDASYYASNVFFWAKMSAFGALGLVSIRPTLRFGRWQRAAAGNPQWVAPREELALTRRAIIAELALFPLIPAFAALMARGFGNFGD
jgi:putative membrane protein